MQAFSSFLSDLSARAKKRGFWFQAGVAALGFLQVSNCTSVKRSELKPATPMLEPPRQELEVASKDAALAIQARDILDKRCVGCHGCYDAPCQLKLTSPEGVERGATKLTVYDGTRVRAVPPSRLGIDAHGVAAWRQFGFHSVLGVPKEHPAGSPILRRMLDLKQKHPLPAGIYLPPGMEVGIDREHICPNWEEMETFEREHPMWGMPYALPGLSEKPVQGPVYYRLIERDETVLAKTHLRYRIGAKRLARWSQLFAKVSPTKGQAVAKEPDRRSNPFRSFASIPMGARYKFLLDDAGFFLGGFIKGPVCRGKTALNVIQDRFWVFFLNPDSQVSEGMSRFLQEVHDDLNLPAEDGSQNSLMRWVEYAARHERYLDKKREFVELEGKRVDRPDTPLWRGDGDNPNAALTVFRHHDSATVVQGLVGKGPKTAWLLTYAELERIHYLLVAGFDVFGNIGHQVNTRLYMDFLRMEGEYNFLLLVGRRQREALVNWWYQDVGGIKEYWIEEHLKKTQLQAPWVKEGISTQAQVYAKLKEALRSVDVGDRYNLSSPPQNPTDQSLAKIDTVPAAAATHFPEFTLLLVQDEQAQLYSILRETAFANVARLLLDKERRRPAKDKLSVFQGVLGAYPNAILEVKKDQLPELLEAMRSTTSESDYAKVLSRFGVRRTNPRFWAVSDQIHETYAKLDPLEYGRLDYNRLENR